MKLSAMLLPIIMSSLVTGQAGFIKFIIKTVPLVITNSNTFTSHEIVRTTYLRHMFGWRYVEIPISYGDSQQIIGINIHDGKMKLIVKSKKTSGKSIYTHYIQNQYFTGTYYLSSNRLSNRQRITWEPEGYRSSWKLDFGQMYGHRAVTMKLVQKGISILIPSSIPAYASEFNPAPGNPGQYDNRILGQTRNWVWIAMKGPGAPLISEIAWGYRQWNRILAINTRTQETQVFSIPKRTSKTDTWGTTPAFGVIGNTVYIATGNWIGSFPASPIKLSSVSILVPEPQRVVKADQAEMLKTLSTLEVQAATGITSFWNNYVMKGHQNTAYQSWILNPNIFNHGDYPPDFYWAMNFPLQPGTHAYNDRATLIQEIEQLLRSPLTTAWVVYPDPSSIKSHFHGTPPTKIPGYHIVDGYYVKK